MDKEKAEEAATRARTERLSVMSTISSLKFANETQVRRRTVAPAWSLRVAPSPPAGAYFLTHTPRAQAKKSKRDEARIVELEKEVETLKLARERDREAKAGVEETLQKVRGAGFHHQHGHIRIDAYPVCVPACCPWWPPPQTKDTLSDTQSRLKAKTLDYVRLQDRLDASETKRIEAEKQLAAVTEEVESLTLQVRL